MSKVLPKVLIAGFRRISVRGGTRPDMSAKMSTSVPTILITSRQSTTHYSFDMAAWLPMHILKISNQRAPNSCNGCDNSLEQPSVRRYR